MAIGVNLPASGKPADASRAELERLRERLELAEEANRQLRDLLAPQMLFPSEWGLNPQQSKLLACLLKSPDGYRSKAALHVAVRGLGDESESGEAIVNVLMCQVRKKLSRYGVGIETVWGRGFRLPPDAKQFVASAVTAPEQAAA